MADSALSIADVNPIQHNASYATLWKAQKHSFLHF